MFRILGQVYEHPGVHCLRPKRLLGLGLAVLAVWLLPGCSSGERVAAASSPGQGGSSEQLEAHDQLQWETLLDRQGAVEVAVMPLDMGGRSAGKLTFQVSMNTHSVDLSMDLAGLSTLETDAGFAIPALSWSGGSGHHVRGTLEFPAVTPEGSPLLQGTKTLKLTIRGVDAEERIFVWEIP